jgi:N-acyl-D-aspartate/D-glutamate deacylase
LRIPSESVVRYQTADTAQLVGMHDRGQVRPGLRADLNLIELSAVGSAAPALVRDLPGGGSRLLGRGKGYVATLVRGQVTLENGTYNGTTAGLLARV